MKKLFCMILGLTMLFGLTACQSSSVNNVTTSTMEILKEENITELEKYMTSSPKVFDNELALISSRLCLATYGDGDSGIRNYLKELGFKDDSSHIYSNNYGGSLAFTLAQTDSFNGDPNRKLLVIVAQGSTNPYELFMDVSSSAKQAYNGYPVYDIVKDFCNAIWEGVESHTELDKEDYVVLVTGHSLGGAAGNLFAAQLTDTGTNGAEDVYCYTFGAIDSIKSDSEVSSGYDNIHNVYNNYDTFSPSQYGGILPSGMGSGVGRFGHLDLFKYDYRSDTDRSKDMVIQMTDAVNHGMANYVKSIENELVTCSLVPGVPDAGTQTIVDSESSTISPYASVQVGDHITLGTYEQDNDTSNGAENISWEVLAVEDGKALIISDYGLALKPYHDKDEEITWEDCTLRSWLNDEFYEGAFNVDEQKYIILSDLENKDNPAYGTEGGNATRDKVFLLSLDEIIEYYDIDESDFYAHHGQTDSYSKLLVPFSSAALEEYHMSMLEINSEEYWKNYLGYMQKNYINDEGEVCCRWHLRSPGFYSYDSAIVDYYGCVDYEGYYVYSECICIRPAMWINLE